MGLQTVDRYFGISDSGSTARREVLGGVTAFASMSCIILVQPPLLTMTGMGFSRHSGLTTVLLMAVLMAHRIRDAVLVGILQTTALCLATGVIPLSSRFRRIAFLLLPALLSATSAWTASDACAFPPWDRLTGSANTRWISGNGGLTVGLDDFGRLVSCRWPSPGYFNQLNLAPDVGANAAPEFPACWGIAKDDAVHWICGPPWELRQGGYTDPRSSLLAFEWEWREAGVRAVQELFVHPEHDLLAIRLILTGGGDVPRLFWRQSFSPCTRHVPGFPLADWAIPGINGFASYVDTAAGHAFQFRPRAPHARDWARARELSARPADSSEWAAFGEGTWIGVSAAISPLSIRCLPTKAPPQDSVEASVIGQASILIECSPTPSPDSGHEAVVYIAFGAAQEEARRLLDLAAQRGYAALREEARSSPRLPYPESDVESVEQVRRSAYRALRHAMDRRSGIVVRAPITRPPMATVTPQTAAWAVWALHCAREPEKAEAQTLFLVDAMRKRLLGRLPAGAVPAALYANGTPASPPLVLDVGATAWTLAACRKHAFLVSPEKRDAYLADIRDAVVSGLDFLAHWTQLNSGQPLPWFDPESLRDEAPLSHLMTAYLGLLSGLELAEWMSLQISPRWMEWRSDMEILLRFQMLNRRTPWPVPLPLLWWLQPLIPANSPLSRIPVESAGGETVLHQLDITQDNPYMEDGSHRDCPDALAAAIRFVAASEKIYRLSADVE